MKLVSLDTLDSYRQSMAKAIQREIESVFGHDLSGVSLDRVKDKNAQLLKHPWIDSAIMDFDPSLLHVFCPSTIDLRIAISALLAGDVVMEHTAAGEATRLGIGTKYTLTPKGIIEAVLTNNILRENHTDAEAKQLGTLTESAKEKTLKIAQRLAPFSIGTRKMAKVSFDITNLAKENGQDPAQVLSKQMQILVLNEATAPHILQEMRNYRFFGFNPLNVYFMVQKSMEGYSLTDGHVGLDFDSEKLLHNHGGMRMQQVMDQQFFRLLPSGEREYLSFGTVLKILNEKKLLVSNNVEDLDQLEINSIDAPSISLGLELGQEGYDMIMTAVGQKTPPQKGGFFAYIPGHGLACFESDQHPGLFGNDPVELEKIKYLNKNVNMFPNPSKMFASLRENDLPTHATVKGSAHKAIYPQTPQGDLNFILKTQVIIEETVSKIRNLKAQSDLLDTVKTMEAQEKNSKFMTWLDQLDPKGLN